MDLVQIRKKAKKEKARQSEQVDVKPVAAAENAAVPAKPVPVATSNEAPSVQVSQQAPPRKKGVERTVAPEETESSAPQVKPAEAPVAPQTIGEILDPLEALFRQSDGGVQFATEENYFDGLVDATERMTEEGARQLLSFALGDEEYAVDITQVREIIKPREITEIPRVPDFMLGIISLRGVIIPVIDLNRRLKLGSATLTPTTRIVVCQNGSRYSGLLVDKIHQVLRMSSHTIEAAPAMLSSLDRDYVSGIGRIQGRMVILLDLAAVMNIEG